jgi:pyridoxamine 5'-phosphate oxidase
MDLKKIKLEYVRDELNVKDLAYDPLVQFRKWFQEAINCEISYPNAATLSTVDKDHFPQSRVILIKEVNDQGIVFFTNYESAKAQQLSANNKAGLNIFWKELDRQIRVTGRVSKISTMESQAYFYSRPRESQISAIASPQSKSISKEELVKEIERIKKKYPDKLPMPKNWGGFILRPIKMEFWQGRPNRLHDRFLYEPSSGGHQITRLAP